MELALSKARTFSLH